jgi:hypothetical protein
MSQHAFRKYAAAIILTGSIIMSTVQAQTLWGLAEQNRDTLRISTLFTAQNVRDFLSGEQGIDKAIGWCKETGVTRVFIEAFRGGYTADRQTLQHAKERFEQAGIDVSGCVTTTDVGKKSSGWNIIACYTDEPTRKRLQETFEYTASIFDEIMIDDFWFTDCECDACQKARGDRTWAEYRCDLMTRVSRQRILEPARAVNPRVKVIIKYPQWYDNFHNRGYEVVQETVDFGAIWVGTETRDPDSEQWGKKAQYEAYYIMRWLGGIGGARCGGGWFDPYGTHEDTYVEQARQTVLADAKEMLLFCYGSLQEETGPANVARLRTEIAGLFKLAAMVRNQPIKGIAAPKPPNSDAYDEQYVYDFVGMLGLPLVPTAEVRTDVKAAFLPIHAMKDPQLSNKLTAMLAAKTPVLITDGLAEKLPASIRDDENVLMLKVNGKPDSLLNLTRGQLKPIREKLLAPFGIRFDAPNKVALYLIGDHHVAIENFNDEAAGASLEFVNSPPPALKQALVLPVKGSAGISSDEAGQFALTLTPRTLAVFEY